MLQRTFMPAKRKKLGEILVGKGLLTPDQMTEALRQQKETGRPLGQLLVDRDWIEAEDLRNILAEQLGIPHLWLRKGLVDPRIVQVLPKEKAKLYQIIPMFCVNDVLTLATADPDAIFVFDEVAKITGMSVQPVVCRVDDIMEAIGECYQQGVNIDEVMSSLDETGLEMVKTTAEKAISEIAEMAEGSPVINLTNSILLKAIRDGASDIHIEPQTDYFRVRLRLDGVLYELMTPKIEMHAAVVSRLKVMANLDIAERRLPQDGRIQVQADGQTIDLRFSSMPGINGEKVVLRILDQRRVILDINKLGFDSAGLAKFKALLRSANGLLLACGPTGSGKTTTLYSAISLLNTVEKNIVTIEDPVEYQLAGINQNQVQEAIGLNFARFLKHALRQDPDIILVGEIRDLETAEIAIQASLTGHLVLSTIHTNDSPTAVTRLLEMGVQPYLISSSLLAAQAQRLVRTICPECKTSFYPPKGVLRELGLDEDKRIRFTHGKGCQACYDSGFKGRTSINEVLQMEDALQGLILDNPSIEMLRGHLKQNGYKTMRADGYDKVVAGQTTIEEVRRVTTIDV